MHRPRCRPRPAKFSVHRGSRLHPLHAPLIQFVSNDPRLRPVAPAPRQKKVDRLRAEVPRLALQAASPNGGTLQDLAKQVLEIADRGLARRARLNRMGDTEQGFLNPLREIAASGLTNADRMLALYHGAWGGDAANVYAAESY